MRPVVTEIVSDAMWHELRAKYVGGSEVAALFDASPWLTKFSLWHRKAGKVQFEDEGDSRMDWGRRLEPVIAQAVADELNLDHWHARAYWALPDIGLGCTLDFSFEDPELGPAIIETKNVDWLVFKSEFGESRPPMKYQFQVQAQLAVTGRKRAVLAAFVGGNALHLYDIRPDAEVIEEIKARTAAFWKSIADNNPPPPTGTEEELSIFARLYPDLKNEPPITLDHHSIEQACADLLWSQAQSRMGKEGSDKAKAILLNAMGDSGHALAPGHRIRVTRSTNKNDVVSTRVKVSEEDTGVIVAPEDVRPFA